MNLPTRVEAEATQELEDAALWYEARRPGLGDSFLSSVDSALSRIATWPQANRLVDGIASDLGVRRLAMSGFPYYVAYVETPEAIRVLAIAHRRRRPNYWRKRL